jgi:hypothetical protein
MAKNKQKTIDSIYKKKSRLSVDGAAVENDSVQEKEDVHGEEEEVEVEDENPLRIQRVNDGSGIFSAMNLVKTRLRNKMEDGFLRDCLLIYIEKEIAVGFLTDEIIDEFNTENRRVPLH